MSLPQAPAVGTAMLLTDTYAGQVVVVTGGDTGLGKAMAAEFARAGAAVAIVSRKPDHGAAGVAAIEAIDGRAIGVEVDRRDADAIASMLDEIEQDLGPADVLVNNAAGNFPSQATKMSPNPFRSVVDIVLNGTFLCSTEFARRAIARNAAGAILDIGPTYSWTGRPGTSHSAAAKGRRHQPRPIPCCGMGTTRHPRQLSGTGPVSA